MSDLTFGGGARAVSATAGTLVKAAPGRLCGCLVTASGTGTLVFTDDLGDGSGTILAIIPATAVAGDMVRPQIPAAVGIYCSGAGTQTVTVSFN